MIEKYKNIFEDIEIDNLSSAITNFMNSLSDINYEASDCFMMNTKALYDGTFNSGINHLKDVDIKGMVDLCQNCLDNVVQKIKDFNTFYNDTYLKAYNDYEEKYKILLDTPETITVDETALDAAGNWYYTGKTTTKTNPDYAAASKACSDVAVWVKQYTGHLKQEEDSIQSVTFN